MGRPHKGTIAEKARALGIYPETIYRRMSGGGKTLEEALAMGKSHQVSRYPSMIAAKYPRLAEYMIANKLTFNEFAEECGISYTTAFNTVYGDSEPGLSTVRKILDATCMTFEEAFKEVDT